MILFTLRNSSSGVCGDRKSILLSRGFLKSVVRKKSVAIRTRWTPENIVAICVDILQSPRHSASKNARSPFVTFADCLQMSFITTHLNSVLDNNILRQHLVKCREAYETLIAT